MLANFPVDILRVLLSNEASFLVIALWKCGDATLNHKLSLAVHHVQLKDLRLTSTSRYPKMLCRLSNLRSLSISRGTNSLTSSHLDLMDNLLLLATDKLETLSIESSEVTTLFTDPRALARVTTNHSDFLYDLSASFPALRSLTLRVKKIPTGAEQREPFRLPPLLTSLKTPSFAFSSDSAAIFSLLPRSLTSWKTTMSWLDGVRRSDDAILAALQRIFQDAPLNLARLSCWASLNMPRRIRFVDFLPKSLSMFEAEPGFHVSCFKDLPCSVKHARIDWRDNRQVLEEEPETLNTIRLLSLCIDLPNSASLGPPQSIVPLPRTLTGLTISSYHIATDDLLQTMSNPLFWPPQLTFFHFSGSLPQTIVKVLPKTLKGLHMSLDEGESENQKEPTLFIPHNLTSFDLSHNDPISHWHLDSSKQSLLKTLFIASHMLDENLFPLLPDSLTDLTFVYDEESHICNPLSPLPLPSRLHSLSVERWSYAWLSALPRSLNSFYCSLVDFKEETLRPGLDLFSALPAGLENLAIQIQGGNSNLLSAANFSGLSGLKLLDATVGAFEPEILENLGTKLWSLEILLTHLDEKTSRFIPPFLTYCGVTLLDSSNKHLLIENWPLEAPSTQETAELKKRKEDARLRSLLYPDPRVLNLPM